MIRDVYYGKSVSGHKKAVFWGNPDREDAKGLFWGDGSINTLTSPQSAALIKHAYPNIYTIVILRDPVERVESHFNMCIRLGDRIDIDKEEASTAEGRTAIIDRYLKESMELALSKTDFEQLQWGKYPWIRGVSAPFMVELGFYAYYIEKWLTFFPDIHFIDAKEYKANPYPDLQRIYNGIGIGEEGAKFLGSGKFVPHISNSGKHEFEMSDAMRQKLTKLYQEKNKKLVELTKREWSF